MYQGNILGKWMRAIGKNIIAVEHEIEEKKSTILTVEKEVRSGWFKIINAGYDALLAINPENVEEVIVYVHPYAAQRVETEGKVYYLFTSDQVLMVK